VYATISGEATHEGQRIVSRPGRYKSHRSATLLEWGEVNSVRSRAIAHQVESGIIGVSAEFPILVVEVLRAIATVLREMLHGLAAINGVIIAYGYYDATTGYRAASCLRD